MGLIPSPHVTDSRTCNPVFTDQSYPCFLWFSIVFHENYGGDSPLLEIKINYFSDRRPVVTPIATDGDSTGDCRESQANLTD